MRPSYEAHNLPQLPKNSHSREYFALKQGLPLRETAHKANKHLFALPNMKKWPTYVCENLNT
ncbi:MAG: hypothetical protein RJA35_611 [Actinomycetota bacterium]|jgi:hypothetical protein